MSGNDWAGVVGVPAFPNQDRATKITLNFERTASKQ